MIDVDNNKIDQILVTRNKRPAPVADAEEPAKPTEAPFVPPEKKEEPDRGSSFFFFRRVRTYSAAVFFLVVLRVVLRGLASEFSSPDSVASASFLLGWNSNAMLPLPFTMRKALKARLLFFEMKPESNCVRLLARSSVTSSDVMSRERMVLLMRNVHFFSPRMFFSHW